MSSFERELSLIRSLSGKASRARAIASRTLVDADGVVVGPPSLAALDVGAPPLLLGPSAPGDLVVQGADLVVVVGAPGARSSSLLCRSRWFSSLQRGGLGQQPFVPGGLGSGTGGTGVGLCSGLRVVVVVDDGRFVICAVLGFLRFFGERERALPAVGQRQDSVFGRAAGLGPFDLVLAECRLRPQRVVRRQLRLQGGEEGERGERRLRCGGRGRRA